MIGICASWNTVFSSVGADSTHCHQSRDRRRQWQLLLGSFCGLLLLSATAQAQTMTPTEPTPAAAATNFARPLVDGVYFYGSAPQLDEIGAAYMVFEAQADDIVGAIYMPQSSFDCFRGRISGNELALQITNSYTQETYDYGIALVPTADAIAAIGSTAAPLQIDGFYDLGSPREADAAILAICQANTPR